MTLTTLARKAHPLNRRHAAKFVLAAKWLRSRNGWVIDQGSKRPKWSYPSDALQ